MQDKIDEFHRYGAEAYGLTIDSHHALKEWGKSLGISYPLLSDFNREATIVLGIKNADHGGYRDVNHRAIFVIDRDGTVAYAEIPEFRGIPDVDAALAALRELSEK